MRRVVPSSSRANARASGRLPTPGGPWKRYACAVPSASAASSRRFASCCSRTESSKLIPHLLRELLDRLRRVERDAPLRERRHDLPVPLVQAAHEGAALAL